MSSAFKQQQFLAKIKKKLSSQFIRNVGWLGMSELFPRFFRLGVTVVLARLLTSYDYGLAAIVLTVNEFTRIFINIGVNQKIVQADEEELGELCDSSYWLNWVVFSSLFVIQCIAAFPIAWFYKDNHLILPICVSAIPYLIWPLSAIQHALIHRENRLKVTAIHNSVQNFSSYLLSIVLAFLNMGMWAIVLPWVLVAPIGTAIYYSNHSWRPTAKFTMNRWREIFNFGKNILGMQSLRTLRNNLDYLLVGRFLGVEELGLYFFGFNAGLGISLSIITALGSATFPHLCAARTNPVEFKRRYFSVLKTIALIVIPLVLLQTSLAPIYVPIVFGQKWVTAIPVLILICLSAIPRPFADAASQLLVSIGRPDLVLRWDVIFTVLFTGGLLIGVTWQATGVALSVLVVHTLGLPLFAIWATRYVFSKFQAVNITG